MGKPLLHFHINRAKLGVILVRRIRGVVARAELREGKQELRRRNRARRQVQSAADGAEERVGYLIIQSAAQRKVLVG